jgi:hypothetical protein
MIRHLLVALVFAVAATAVQAQIQMRTIPANAKRATMTHVAGMTVEMNGNRVLLATGAQIRDAGNMIVVPTALPPGSLVKYQLDAQGQIWRIWILSPQEAAQPDPKQ